MNTYRELRQQMAMAASADPGTVLVRALVNVPDTPQPVVPGYIRASLLHLGARQLAYIYSLTPPDRSRFTATIRRKLRQGIAMHQKFQEELSRAMDVDLEVVAYEQEYKSSEYHLVGHLDAVVKIKGRVYGVEYKSTASYVYDRLRSPLPYHEWQVGAYALMSGYPMIILYENKDTQQLATFLWSLTPEWKQRIVEKVQDVMDALESDKVLPLCPTGCKECPFHGRCVRDRMVQGLPLEDPS
jgi:predicted Zn-ribbon and HTH transcriptional regulator